MTRGKRRVLTAQPPLEATSAAGHTSQRAAHPPANRSHHPETRWPARQPPRTPRRSHQPPRQPPTRLRKRPGGWIRLGGGGDHVTASPGGGASFQPHPVTLEHMIAIGAPPKRIHPAGHHHQTPDNRQPTVQHRPRTPQRASTEPHSAHLDSAHLDSAHLDSAHLDSAHLDSAHLDSAHLDSAHLDSAHLDSAHLDSAHLDSDKAHPSQGGAPKSILPVQGPSDLEVDLPVDNSGEVSTGCHSGLRASSSAASSRVGAVPPRWAGSHQAPGS
ncbi:hypothetical protein DFQ13_106358 [Actinokineospora spheciospongiae]|nr:hypothetical protein DFQ13_106358 [Actinokineospora spheciospongiae]